jgi:polyisoprenoid-binding protein YceI
MSTEILTIAPAGTWQLDPVHSHVGFEVDYLGGTFKGEFDRVSAKLEARDGGATIEGVAEVAGVNVKDENLAAHLQSPDFFDAERYPQLSFFADSIDLDGKAVDAEGRITIKGVTRPVHVSGTVTAPITDHSGRERVGLELEAVVDRTQFGIDWNAPLPAGGQSLSNDVRLVTELFFVKEA